MPPSPRPAPRVHRSPPVFNPPDLIGAYRDPRTGRFQMTSEANKAAAKSFLGYTGDFMVMIAAFGFARWGLKFIGSVLLTIFGLLFLLVSAIFG